MYKREEPVNFHDVSGTAPVSHISVPFGWTIRKQGTDIRLIATSSFFNPNLRVSIFSRTPPSNTYNLIKGCSISLKIVVLGLASFNVKEYIRIAMRPNIIGIDN